MVDYYSVVSFPNSRDHRTNMANSLNSADQSANSKQIHQILKNRKQPTSTNHVNVSFCNRSRTAAIDIVILIAVLGAVGFLMFPYVKLVFHGIYEIRGVTLSMVRGEINSRAIIIYLFIGLGFSFATIAIWGILGCTRGRKCDNPNCRGLRKAAEFDIQLETEEYLKNLNSSSVTSNNDGGRGMFVLGEGHHRELEAELRKMAPVKGRAVLVFRARCGCAVGKMQVWGPKKVRKIKK